jgi:AbrB family looped-hinge helix DNA binding protein
MRVPVALPPPTPPAHHSVADRGRRLGEEGRKSGAAELRPNCGEVRWYLTFMRTKVSSKGQIVLPAELRHRDGIEAGQEFEVERVGADEYRLVRVALAPNEGLVDWLLSCPQKDYFVPIESESTETL